MKMVSQENLSNGWKAKIFRDELVINEAGQIIVPVIIIVLDENNNEIYFSKKDKEIYNLNDLDKCGNFLENNDFKSLEDIGDYIRKGQIKNSQEIDDKVKKILEMFVKLSNFFGPTFIEK